MVDWNLGKNGNPRGDLLTDALNDAHGHLVASSIYHAGHNNSDDAPDLHEAEGRDYEVVDEESCGLPEQALFSAEEENTLFDALGEEDKLFVAIVSKEWEAPEESHDYDNSGSDMYVGIDNQSFFKYQHHRGCPKGANIARSEVLSVAYGRGVAKGEVAHRGRQQIHGNLRVQ